MQAQDIYIEFHAWSNGSPAYPARPATYVTPVDNTSAVQDVTQFVTDISWSQSINPPWGTAILQMDLPFNLIAHVFPGRPVSMAMMTNARPILGTENNVTLQGTYGQIPETGFWVIIGQRNKDGTKRAIGIYRCTDLSFSHQPGPGGVVEIQNVAVSCESWLSFLGASRMQFSPAGGPWNQPGFSFDIASWESTLSALLKGRLHLPVGEVLQSVWQELIHIGLPPSISGDPTQTIGTLFPIVWNEETAVAYAPLREGAIEPVIGYQITTGSVTPGQQTLLNYILSLFGADPRLLEFFPSLEYNPSVDQPTETNAVAKKIGVTPVLVYRLKPWFVKAITTANVNEALDEDQMKDGTGNRIKSSQKTACEQIGYAQTPSATRPAILNEQRGSAWFDITADDIEQLTFSWSDMDRVNLVFSSNFAVDAGPIIFGTGVGTPLVRDNQQVVRHGLRPTELRWPFFPPQNAVPDNSQTQQANQNQKKDDQPPQNSSVTDVIPGTKFKYKDFKCHNGEQVPQHLRANCEHLAQQLQKLQDLLGSTYQVFVQSGYRSPSYNAALVAKNSGAAANSLHMQAAAADTKALGVGGLPSLPPTELFVKMYGWISAGYLEDGQLEICDNWVHYAPGFRQNTGISKPIEGRLSAKTKSLPQLIAQGKDFAKSLPPPLVGMQPFVKMAAVNEPTSGTTRTEPDIITYGNAITEMGWAVAGESERFCRGSAVIAYRPFVQHGHWIRIYQKTYCLTAYVDNVVHRVYRSNDSGAPLIAMTRISFTRGTLRYYDAQFQDPHYQAPMMTFDVNAKGSPDFAIKIQGKQLQESIAQQEATTPRPAAQAFRYVPNPPSTLVPAGGLATKARKYIILHQTGTSTIKEMLAGFKKKKTYKKKDGKPETYYLGTNYTVDRDGTTIRWVDPNTYYTNNASSGRDDMLTEQTVSVDFVGRFTDNLTPAQIQAGGLLLQKLSADHNIPLNIAPDRLNAGAPVIARGDETNVEYGIFRHRSFSGEWTACGGKIDANAMLDFIKSSGNLVSFKELPDNATYIKDLLL